jgi:hypothetical protein
MLDMGNPRRKALAMSIGWWYLRRLVRKRGAAAVAGFVAGEGLSLARRPRKRHPLRWLLLLALVGGGVYWWWQQREQGDDWGDWDPGIPADPLPGETAVTAHATAPAAS